MKSCRGCKYRVWFMDNTPSRCKQGEEWTAVRLYDPYDDRELTQWRRGGPAAPYAEEHFGRRPTLMEMRAPTGRCGPEAHLYEPTLLRKLLVRFRVLSDPRTQP